MWSVKWSKIFTLFKFQNRWKRKWFDIKLSKCICLYGKHISCMSYIWATRKFTSHSSRSLNVSFASTQNQNISSYAHVEDSQITSVIIHVLSQRVKVGKETSNFHGNHRLIFLLHICSVTIEGFTNNKETWNLKWWVLIDIHAGFKCSAYMYE